MALNWWEPGYTSDVGAGTGGYVAPQSQVNSLTDAYNAFTGANPWYRSAQNDPSRSMMTPWQIEHQNDWHFLNRFPTQEAYRQAMGTDGSVTGGGLYDQSGQYAGGAPQNTLSGFQFNNPFVPGTVGDPSLQTFDPNTGQTTSQGQGTGQNPILQPFDPVTGQSPGFGGVGQPPPQVSGILPALPEYTPPAPQGLLPQGDGMTKSDLYEPETLWGSILDTVQSGDYTQSPHGFRSPYWNPDPYMEGWPENFWGTGQQQLNEMITNAPVVEQTPFVHPGTFAAQPDYSIPQPGYWGTDMTGNPIWVPQVGRQYTEGSAGSGGADGPGGPGGGYGDSGLSGPGDDGSPGR